MFISPKRANREFISIFYLLAAFSLTAILVVTRIETSCKEQGSFTAPFTNRTYICARVYEEKPDERF
jgi:hypothetical protein